MPEVASIDLIGQMIELCGIFFADSQHTSCCHGDLGYPPRATSYFHGLVHGRKLIGKVREMLPEASEKVIESAKVKGRLGQLGGPFGWLTLLVMMHPDVPCFIVLLCLMPDNFTHQGVSATQRV